MLQSHKLLVHKALKGTGGIGQTKRHHFELKQAPLARKRSEMGVLGRDFNLMISLLQIKAAEDRATRKTVQNLVNTRDGISVQTSIGV